VTRMKENLFISFSGGETSAFMAQLLIRRKDYKNILCVFANTGQENEQTLEFIERCDNHFGLKTVWLEAKINEAIGKGGTWKVVNFNSACRNGERSFEPMIKKYGIPNMQQKHCTRELKTNPLYGYVNSIFGRGNYDTAIGIRADEIDRVNENYREKRIIYPLVDMKITKPMINKFWSEMPFRLELKGYQGNCKWCWKKTLRKHVTIARETPHYYDFPIKMEEKYGMCGALAKKHNEPQVFFRKKMSAKDILSMVDDTSIKNADDDSIIMPDLELDLGSGCGESCEIEHDGF
jgi:hypothetical protein